MKFRRPYTRTTRILVVRALYDKGGKNEKDRNLKNDSTSIDKKQILIITHFIILYTNRPFYVEFES